MDEAGHSLWDGKGVFSTSVRDPLPEEAAMFERSFAWATAAGEASAMTSRIHRGFHRIGIVSALPPLVGAGCLAALGLWRQVVDRGPWEDYEGAPTYLPDYRLALALYAACRAVGWVLAGCMGPSTRT